VRPANSVFFYPLKIYFSSPSWRRGAFYFLPLLVYGALIFYGSSQSRWFFNPPEFFSVDKVYHFLEYGIFGVLSARFINGYHFSSFFRGKMIWVTALAILYGASDEFHQWFVPGRLATFGDWLADSLG